MTEYDYDKMTFGELREFSKTLFHINIDGTQYERIKWCRSIFSNVDGTCPDCGVEHGALHVWSCDQEVCPKCGGQLLGCDCGPDDEDEAE